MRSAGGGGSCFGAFGCGEWLRCVTRVSFRELAFSSWAVKDTVEVGDVVVKTESDTAANGVLIEEVLIGGVLIGGVLIIGVVINGVVYVVGICSGVIYPGFAGMAKGN